MNYPDSVTRLLNYIGVLYRYVTWNEYVVGSWNGRINPHADILKI
jgi:hypothetical protein